MNPEQELAALQKRLEEIPEKFVEGPRRTGLHKGTVVAALQSLCEQTIVFGHTFMACSNP